MNQKGFSPVLILILVAGAILGGVYLFLDRAHPVRLYSVYTYPPLRKTIVASGGTKPAAGSQTQTIEGEEIAADWVEYIHTTDKYSFLYPKSWHLRECYPGNVYLSPRSMEGKQCNAQTMEESIEPLISIFSADMSVEQLIKEARDTQGFIADFIEKSTEINNKTYRQMLIKLKIIPPWAIPSTTGVTTFIEVPERNQVVNVAIVGLDDDREDANIYRQIISSFKTIPQQSEIANWEIYTSEKLGFSLRYPNDIEIFKSFDDGSVILSRKGEQKSSDFPVASMQILFRAKAGTDPQAALMSETPECTPEAEKLSTACAPSTKQAQINNAIGLQVTSTPGYDYYLIGIERKTPVVRILISSDIPEKDLGVFQQILSTFRFD